jgi:hypothetical protein
MTESSEGREAGRRRNLAHEQKRGARQRVEVADEPLQQCCVAGRHR